MSHQPEEQLAISYNPHIEPIAGFTKLDLRELGELFDGNPEAQITKQVWSRKEPLWKGVFGMLEGPCVVPSADVTQSYRGTRIEAHNYWQSKWGGLRQLPHHANIEAEGLKGKDLAALCAYLGKTAPFTVSPSVSSRYQGPMPPQDQYIGTIPGFMTSPFGTEQAHLALEPDGGIERSGNPFDKMIFMGRVSASTSVKVHELPTHVAKQEAALAGFTRRDIQGELYGLYGAENPEQLSTVWQEAMEAPSPASAARIVQEALG